MIGGGVSSKGSHCRKPLKGGPPPLSWAITGLDSSQPLDCSPGADPSGGAVRSIGADGQIAFLEGFTRKRGVLPQRFPLAIWKNFPVDQFLPFFICDGLPDNFFSIASINASASGAVGAPNTIMTASPTCRAIVHF